MSLCFFLNCSEIFFRYSVQISFRNSSRNFGYCFATYPLNPSVNFCRKLFGNSSKIIAGISSARIFATYSYRNVSSVQNFLLLKYLAIRQILLECHFFENSSFPKDHLKIMDWKHFKILNLFLVFFGKPSKSSSRFLLNHSLIIFGDQTSNCFKNFFWNLSWRFSKEIFLLFLSVEFLTIASK